MNFKSTFLLALLLILLQNLQGQDVHYTLFNFNPLIMNPAISGSYEGTARIGGIYRDQSRGVSNAEPYTTPSFFVDAPILMVGKRDWVGVGVMFFQDNAGSLSLQTSSFQISGAFHHAFDKKSNTVMSLGVQWGQLSRSIDCARFEPGSLLDPSINLPDMSICNNANSDDPEATGTDINVGLYLKSKVNKTTDYNVGLSFRHLTSPDLSFGTGGSNDDSDLGLRIILHGELNMELTDKWSLHPAAYFTNLSPASQFQLQGWGGYRINEEKDMTLKFGLGYRIGDAGQFLVGLEMGDLRVGVAYDLTLSSLSDINNRNGGIEIAANYIIKIYKKPDVKPQILCPRL